MSGVESEVYEDEMDEEYDRLGEQEGVRERDDSVERERNDEVEVL